MRQRRWQIRIWMNDTEKAHVDAIARRLHLSRADFLRRLAMGYRIPEAEDFEARETIHDLLKVNADLARLGNLFKLALDERTELPPDTSLRESLDNLTQEIVGTQEMLRTCVRRIHNGFHDCQTH